VAPARGGLDLARGATCGRAAPTRGVTRTTAGRARGPSALRTAGPPGLGAARPGGWDGIARAGGGGGAADPDGVVDGARRGGGLRSVQVGDGVGLGLGHLEVVEGQELLVGGPLGGVERAERAVLVAEVLGEVARQVGLALPALVLV